MFWATRNLGIDTLFVEFGLEDRLDIVDKLLSFRSFLFQRLGDRRIGHGIQVAEGEVLEFPLELPDTEAARQGRIDLTGLDRDRAFFFVRRMPRTPEPIELFGDAHEYEAHIRDDGQ